MARFIKSTGEIAIGTLLTIAGIWFVSVTGSTGYATVINAKTNDKVELQGRQISTMEQQNKQTEQDIKEIKSDIKEILRVVGGRPVGEIRGVNFSKDEY